MATRRTEQSIWNGLDGFDKLLEHRTRLAACVILSRADRISFPRLKTLLEETDGSLGAHMRKLEEVKFVRVEKAFKGRRPITWYALTAQGQRALLAHLDAMSKLIKGETFDARTTE